MKSDKLRAVEPVSLHNQPGTAGDRLRMLLPDNYVQHPDFSQNYNRYTYCLNNPLEYTDKSGYKYKKNPDTVYGEGNYWYRADAPRTWGAEESRYVGGGGFLFDSQGMMYGAPGFGQNGAGLNGVYYDNYSHQYRSTNDGNPVVGFSSVYQTIGQYSSFSLTRQDSYAGVSGDLAYKGTIYKTSYSNAPKGGGGGLLAARGGLLAQPQGQGGKPGFNVDNAVDYLNEHAYPKYDKATCGNCAKAVRLSLEAGGINTLNHPVSAKDYGPYLTKWGFSIVNRANYEPLKGDLRVFQNYTGGSIHGHLDMYNGNQWVSDFFENGFWPGRGYRENNAALTIYRWGD